MTTPAKRDEVVWIGNHRNFIWRFATYLDDTETSTTAYPLTGVSVFFTVFNADTKLVEKSTTAGTVTVSGNQASSTLTPADTRIIGDAVYEDGVKPTYEVEFRQAGIETTWLYGKLNLKGGDNADA
jgi:hypothetical protein